MAWPTLCKQNPRTASGWRFIDLTGPAYGSSVKIVRGYRSVWSCVAVVALICNVIASAFCCAPSSARKTVFVDPTLGAIPLCTTDFAGNNDGKKPDGTKHHCPICLAAANKALTVPGITLPVAPKTFALATATRDEDPAIPHRLRLAGLGSRAPPLSA